MSRLRITAAVLLAAMETVAVAERVARGAPENIMSEEHELDSAPTPSQLITMKNLTPDQVRRIDEVLLAQAVPQWRKASGVVGFAMKQLRNEHPGLPDVYYAGRLSALVAAGKLESKGDLRRMRFSEVRLSGS